MSVAFRFFFSLQIERRDERRRRIQSARDAAAAAGEERGEEIEDHTYGAVNRRVSAEL